MLFGKPFARGIIVHRCEFSRQGFRSLVVVTMRDYYPLMLFFIRFEDRHAPSIGFLADHRGKFPQQQSARSDGFCQSQRDQLEGGFAPALLLRSALIVRGQRGLG